MIARSAPPLTIGALGVVTIVAYGACYYAFGVLVTPIQTDTGWSLAQLGAVFSVGLVVNGAIGLVGGRMSDLVGTRLVFLAAQVPAMIAAASPSQPPPPSREYEASPNSLDAFP